MSRSHEPGFLCSENAVPVGDAIQSRASYSENANREWISAAEVSIMLKLQVTSEEIA